jgi:hypothetical protein
VSRAAQFAASSPAGARNARDRTHDTKPYSKTSQERARLNARSHPDAMRVRIATFIFGVKRASTCHCRAMSAWLFQ